MKPAEFRKLALALPDVVEASHMGHPDFRVRDRIFATLGYPDAGFATVMVTPPEQDALCRDYPKAFTPVAGAWGARGATSVRLSLARRRAVELALESAWGQRARRKAKKPKGSA